MPETPQFKIRLEPEYLAALERWRKRWGYLAIAEVIRELIRAEEKREREKKQGETK